VNHLLRELAPLSDDGWKLVDDEARARLLPGLAARRLVDFSGPHGFAHSATNLGRVGRTNVSPLDAVEAHLREVLPLVELRVPFTIARSELLAGDRGAADVDLGDLDAAAQRLVEAENTAVFHGWPNAGIQGIAEASPHAPISRGDDFDAYPARVASAVELLLRGGIGGPYGIALGAREWTHVVETTEHGGYPLFAHLREILQGPLVWAPGVEGAVVLSLRGGDYLYECGQDVSVGYASHDAHDVELYLEETFSFRVATPEAAVAIVSPQSGSQRPAARPSR
jgi:uncharacterized linocin/CFP29 family protein